MVGLGGTSINGRIAHSLGRPSHINTNDWNVPPLTQYDFVDDDLPDGEASPFSSLANEDRIAEISGIELFINMASLTMILSDTLDSL
jgi:hypothetical protein